MVNTVVVWRLVIPIITPSCSVCMYVCMCVCIAGDANELTRLKDEVEKLKRILAEKDKQIASLQETIKSKKAAGAAAQVLRYGGFVSRCMYVRTYVVCVYVCMYGSSFKPLLVLPLTGDCLLAGNLRFLCKNTCNTSYIHTFILYT